MSRTAPRLRVLQVSAFFAAHGGGIEVVGARLGRELATLGHRVTWMAGGPLWEWPGAVHAGVRCVRAGGIDPLERVLGLPFPLWGPRALARLWREVGLHDVVHVHDYLYCSSMLAVVFARLRGRAVVMTQHIGEIPFRSPALRWLLRLLNRTLGRRMLDACHAVAFVSRPVHRQFERLVRRPDRCRLVPNGVDHGLFSVRARPGQADPSAPLKALFVGRFVEKKGVDLLRACMDLPRIEWTFVGRGPRSPRDWPEADRARIAAIHAPMAPDDLARLFQAADLLVLPSTGEGFPLVVQEALACGTPVLVSREVAEAFEATDPRCVFDADTRGPQGLDRLRDALARLASDEGRRVLAAGRQAAADLARQWSWAQCAERYGDIYHSVSVDRVPVVPTSVAEEAD